MWAVTINCEFSLPRLILYCYSENNVTIIFSMQRMHSSYKIVNITIIPRKLQLSLWPWILTLWKPKLIIESLIVCACMLGVSHQIIHGYRLHACMWMCDSITWEMFQWCMISATGSLATEHPHPSSPSTGGVAWGTVAKNKSRERVRLHCMNDNFLYVNFPTHAKG